MEEFDAVENAKTREWGPPPPDKKYDEVYVSVLLKDENHEILAQAELIPIDDVVFNDETFSIIGISGVTTNKRGKGYGRKLLEVVKKYLVEGKKTGVGFTSVPGFYEKCGLSLDRDALKRFVHISNGEKITNTTDEYVVFYDGEDKFMHKVLAHPNKDVHLPRKPNW